MILFPSILAPLERLLERVYIHLHTDLHLSWAWSIIALTAIVRTIIFPITSKQTRSSLAMQRLAPHVKNLQARYKDDRAALNQATMEFYRDNKVNPLASCFPLLIQIPVFLSLFFVLKHFDPPSGTSQDFSWLFSFVDNIKDPINDSGASGWILLVLYILSQMTSTWTMMTSPNPQQKYVFLVMPIFFAVFIYRLPVGLLLYWITTNLWSLGQYLLVVRFSDASKEVVLPADSKGRKKVITPKGSKGSPATAGNSRNSGGSGQSGNAPARRNKRRR